MLTISLLLQSLVDIVNRIRHMSYSGKAGSVIKTDTSVISGQGGLTVAEKPFDAMNNIVANLLLNITRYSTSVWAHTVLSFLPDARPFFTLQCVSMHLSEFIIGIVIRSNRVQKYASVPGLLKLCDKAHLLFYVLIISNLSNKITYLLKG